MTAAQAIVESLKREQVRNVFCVPGESYLAILNALYDVREINVISARHESGAAFMAEGYAKTSGEPGVVLATRGVGATNLSIGVHTAYQDSTPMIVLLGQVNHTFRGREAFQEVDLDRFFGHIAKWAVEINDPKRIPEMMQKAFHISRSGRPGPVVISLPEDVLQMCATMQFGFVSERPKPAPSSIEGRKFQEILEQAKRPLIIAGGGVKRSNAEEELLAFAELFNIPVMTSFRRHDVFPNDHPLYAGHLGIGISEKVREMIKTVDVLLVFGTRLSEVTTQAYTLIQPKQKLIHVDISYESIGNVYPPILGIVADIKEALKQFSHLDISKNFKTWAKDCHQIYQQVLQHADDRTINRQVIELLKETLPHDAILTNDAGNFAAWLHTFYSFQEKKTYVGPTSGAMGYGMPAALGAKLANRDRLVVSLSGDGGFMMTAQELETAVRYELPIISLVFNNRMYGTIRMHQEIHYPEKVIGTDLGDVSFVQLAKSLGAEGFFAQTLQDVKQSLQKAISLQKPTVIEIFTDQEYITVGQTITDLQDQ